jgi:1,4-dihydroxy-2-naphthoate octaprenyltransferase
VLAVIGLLLAHAANNLINDYFDLEGGVDTSEYARAQYAPHPVLSGMLTKDGLRRAILTVNGLDVLIGVILFLLHAGRDCVCRAGAVYQRVLRRAAAAPQAPGPGRTEVFLIWGPLMIGGTYFVTTDTISWPVIVASLPYAILVMTVLMGKHLDKFESDRDKGIHTLPVVLGYAPARTFTRP